jgi:flavin-dependent dehydrogenase
MRRTPALILGGGPAGAAAAIRLAQAGADHLLVERSRSTGDALCGGFLSWRTLDTLDRLGIPADALNPHAVRRVRLFAGGREAGVSLPKPARGVSRHRLDTLMLARAEAVGARVERGMTAREIDGAQVRFANGDTVRADAVFLASGKHDVRGLTRPAAARGSDPALGLRVRLAAAPALARAIGDAIELHLFDRGYAGLMLQEDGSANLCLAVHRSRLSEAGDPAALLQALGRESPVLGDRLAHMNAAPIDAIANVPYGWRATDGVAGLFRLGDQAGVIPSLAGEGMGIAVASGVRAASAYLEQGPHGAVTFQREFARDLRRPLAVAGMVKRLVETPTTARLVPSLASIMPRLIQIMAQVTRVPLARH